MSPWINLFVSVSIFENLIKLIQQRTFKYNSNSNWIIFNSFFYLKRNSEQAHIPNTPPLHDNDTKKEWQGKR